jgi:hypothetical protein
MKGKIVFLLMLLLLASYVSSLNETFEVEVKVHTYYNSSDFMIEIEGINKTYQTGVNSDSLYNVFATREVPTIVDCNQTIYETVDCNYTELIEYINSENEEIRGFWEIEYFPSSTQIDDYEEETVMAKKDLEICESDLTNCKDNLDEKEYSLEAINSSRKLMVVMVMVAIGMVVLTVLQYSGLLRKKKREDF